MQGGDRRGGHGATIAHRASDRQRDLRLCACSTGGTVAAVTRTLLVNADDLGMYSAVNAAVLDCLDAGVVRSASLMPPCPGAAEAADLLRGRSGVAVGAHLTLVCDDLRDRWGPISDGVPSLLRDGALLGCDEVPELLARAALVDVEREFRTQIEAVLAAGIHPTHLDWHCLADGGRADIRDLTLDLAAEYGTAVRMWGADGRAELRRRGFAGTDRPFVDSFALGPIPAPEREERFIRLLRELPDGLTEWAVHPGLGDAGARAVDPGGWPVRAGDHAAFTSADLAAAVHDAGVVLTDYSAVRDAGVERRS